MIRFQDAQESELQALEAAVQRMARIMLEIGPTGKADGHAHRLLNVRGRTTCCTHIST